MRATDELRHLLDKHDVDWSSEVLADCIIVTMWTDGETAYEFNELIDSNHAYLEMNINPCTPGEAIAAWNSRADYHGYEQAAIEAWESIKAWNSRAERMCEMRADGAHCMNGVEFYECRSCGEYACIPTMMGKSEPPNYCPNCGAKVRNE